jgi:hypothetical protein
MAIMSQASSSPDASGAADWRSDPAQRERAMRIRDLEREDRYHRERYALYRAKVYGPRATSSARLQALRLASDAAERRLRGAREQASPAAAGP